MVNANHGAQKSEGDRSEHDDLLLELIPSPPKLKPVSLNISSAAQDWEQQKRRGAQNTVLDQLMAGIGLETVKTEFLAIKAKVDLSNLQGVDLKKERFCCVMLGNPGTGKTLSLPTSSIGYRLTRKPGKTAVARLYAEFLETLANNAFNINSVGICDKEIRHGSCPEEVMNRSVEEFDWPLRFTSKSPRVRPLRRLAECVRNSSRPVGDKWLRGIWRA
ncbi:hypothetical protein B0H63DRAFT_462750 [Podospora didyma]|uniref:Uncharacterized protein n=1 Tax=Podospora didyma TaxID=330526 RepID=A0AAE0U957_9PEZI|nr:hypothetical protein B0H63DRAFT_462750 [Podospora didyma]